MPVEVKAMYKPTYGDPVVALRLPREMIAAARISAKNHDTTFSGLVRSLIESQLEQDGIHWQRSPEPITGQVSVDDVARA